MAANNLLTQLRAVVGDDYVIDHREDLLVYEYDGSVDRSMPRAVVLPADAAQVSQVMALAYAAGVTVVGRGSGTGLSGGAITPPDGLQIAFTRMNRIIAVDTVNRTALVEPGVINLDLDNHARQFGLRYAPDPSSQRACSLGGNIAENAGGPHCLAYGATTNHVIGMEVVLEDGEVVNLGGAAREAAGYDLRGAFVGSEGTFGIATKILVRLLPAPESVRTFLGIFADIDAACTAVSAIVGQGIIPAALEMIDALSIQAVQNVTDAGYPNDAGAVLLIELEGLDEEVAELGASVAAALWDTGAADVRIAAADAERERLWLGRKTAFGAFGTIAPNYYLVDGVVPRTQLTRMLRKVSEVSDRYGITIANVFHAGDGNLHPCMLFDAREPTIMDKAMAAAAELMQECAALGGTLSGEHGIGLEKKEFMPLVYTDADLAAMQRVREAFAPQNRLNPGKIFPDDRYYRPTAAHPAGLAAGLYA